MAQTFDANSARSQLVVTLGETADFVNDFIRDNLSRLTRIEQYGVGGGNSVAEKRIDLSDFADGRYDAISRYADLAGTDFVLTTSYSYDGLGRLANLAHFQGETDLAGYDFTYDVGSRITEIDSLVDGLAEYFYDHTSQLVGADFANQANETHEWDENGNHAASNFVIGANNKIASDGTFNYEYDDEGNLILKTNISTGDTIAFVWDHRNRLTDVINRDDLGAVTQEVHFVYDFLNRWIARTADEDGAGVEDPTSIFFVYDGVQIVLELDDAESEAPAHRYLWTDAVDHLMADENALGDVLYPLADHLNTIRDLAEYDAVEEETSIFNHIKYESFGKVLNESTPTDFRFWFTSRPIDEITQLQNNLHRWYSVDLGWWLSEDPIGFAGGDANTSRYAQNAPIDLTDPNGLEPQKKIIVGDTQTVLSYRDSADAPGLVQVGKIDQVFMRGIAWNYWKNSGKPYGFLNIDEHGYARVNCTAGAYIAGYRQPADPFMLGLGDLPDKRAGEGWPAFPGSVLGPPGVIIGASKAPGIAFTYGLPPSGVITKETIGYILDSMRKAEELLRTQGRANELQAQQAAIKQLVEIAKHLNWPTSSK